MRDLTAASMLLLLLAGCPGDERDNVTDESGPADGDTGPAPAPDAPAPKPTPEPDPAAESCVDELARVKADLAACLAK